MEIQKQIRKLGDPVRAKQAQRFFKTGKGEYAEGDIFLGISVPEIRKLTKPFQDLSLTNLQKLTKSKYHEERLAGLILLVHKYESAPSESEKEQVFKTYVGLFPYINNWDLVDVSCHRVVGAHLENRSRKRLYAWAKSEDLWIRRISMVSTLWFIRKGDLEDAFSIARIHLNDEHDLMHKAVGWMLRECGKKWIKSNH